jgi:HlyD family secretion protein
MSARSRWILVLVILVVAGLVGWRVVKGRPKPVSFRTDTVQRGDIKVQVSATGNLEAVTTVQVGSQVSGTIASLYADYNDRVHTGQTLAQLDPTFLKAQVAQSAADLEHAEVQLRQAVRDSVRAFALGAQGLASQVQLDQAQTALDAARADVASSRAGLVRAQTNLQYATIDSPIDGVVISRNVDVGQTVAASLQAPTLFTIANDLTHMQLQVAVDEADIGQVRDGQPATFTVDAYPDLTFRGTVHQIRLDPQTVQNVVTYNVVIYVDNPELKLLPGMTANVTILIDETKDVLKVPAMALRVRMPQGLVPGNGGGRGRAGGQGEAGASDSGGGRGAAARGGPGGHRPGGGGQPGGASAASLRGGGDGPSGRSTETDTPPPAWSIIYTLNQAGKPRAIRVRTGDTDGTFTAVYSDSLREGMPVVLAVDAPGAAGQSQQGVVNPFTPRFGGGRR